MTKKKKCLGFIYCASGGPLILKRILSNNRYFIKNISSCFKEIYILNLSNLYLFKKKQSGFEKIFRSFKFDNKIKFYSPKSILELKNFLRNKDFHGILSMRRKIPKIYIYFFLKKYKIKLFQISNIGNVNYSNIPIAKNFFRSRFAIYWKRFNHKLFVILNIIGITPKIEIRFLSNSSWINAYKNNQSVYNKLFRFFNFGYAKKLMTINSRAYDLFYKNKFTLSEKYIVLLDESMDDPQYLAIRGYTDKKKLKLHYQYLIEKLKIISKYYKKKVVICIHPNDNLKQKKKIYSEFLVKQFETKKYVYQSKLVLFFESSAIIDAIILKKKNYDYLIKGIRYKSNFS